jgi:hypothetical protein
MIVSVLLGAWLGMQWVHELGHIIAARLTGGRVEKVVLHPLTISRTEVSPNPHPRVVAWAGPILGVLYPLVLWAIMRALWPSVAFVPRFFAGFCFIANGAYLGVGSFERIGDAGDLVRHGSPVWCLWAFGFIAIPAGLLLWHRQGQHFGLGVARGRVSRGGTYLSLATTLGLALLGLLFP